MPSVSGTFDYSSAFARNIGWVTDAEQAQLRNKCVAVAGLGGVGFQHAVALARLGIGSLSIADFDRFDLPNFNRQAGAMMSTVGRPKLDVAVEILSDINPGLNIRLFPAGVNEENLGSFLAQADIYLDGLDFSALDARRATFAACARLNIPAVTAAPLGMSVALLNFLPGKMTFEEYFRMEGHPKPEQALRFLLGLSPAMLQRGYLMDTSTVDLEHGRGPSTIMGCQLCTGVAVTEVLKILLKRGKVLAAPWGMQFDAYRGRMVKTWRPWGNNNPLQKLMIAIARRQFNAVRRTSDLSKTGPFKDMTVDSADVRHILDIARWAPSGDNEQPWRFEILANDRVAVHAFDTREDCVYDIDGHASHIAVGCLLENISIAASTRGLAARFLRRPDGDDRKPIIDVMLSTAPDTAANPLASVIVKRSVQRRPMRTTSLTAAQKEALEASVKPGYEIAWLESLKDRLRVASLTYHSAKLRLTMPEAYAVHREIIDWGKQFSETKVPDKALGASSLSLPLMKFALKSWSRANFINQLPGGTVMPRVELDWLPGMLCAAHCLIVAKHAPTDIDGYLEAGRAVQRFWLTATQLDLQHQPEITPLVFAAYARAGRSFSSLPGTLAYARGVADRLEVVAGTNEVPRVVWMGRIGHGTPSKARSLRLPLESLLISASPAG
jgi:molybdopterin/thiamine biosynthesis adenylyltransferase